MFVSVAICTWNRAKLLDRTLTRMRDLRIPDGVEWELLIVNNNCTDHTDAVIAKHTGALPIQRLFEPRQGKCVSANLAIAQARGELLLWTDDDVLVHRDWIGAYIRAASEWPDYGFFCGRVDPWFEIEPPDWLVKRWVSLKHVFASIDLGDEVKPLPAGCFPMGANMAIRLETQRNHPFNIYLGPSKLNNVRGDDNRLYVELCKSGVRSLWVGDARVEHFIPSARISKQYIGEWYEGAARTVIREGLFSVDPSTTWFGVPRWRYREHAEAVIRYYYLSMFDETRAFDEFIRLRKLRGTILELLGTQKRREL